MLAKIFNHKECKAHKACPAQVREKTLCSLWRNLDCGQSRVTNGSVKNRLSYLSAWLLGVVLILGATFETLVAMIVPPPIAILQDTPSLAALDKIALQSLQKKDYPTAEKLLRQLLTLDRRYQEPSGRSAWHQLGLALERQGKIAEAVQAMRQGWDSLRVMAANDWYLNYDLARLYAEHFSAGNAGFITELIYAVFKNSTPGQQPELWQRLFKETTFMLDKPERVQFKKQVVEKKGEPGKILLKFFRREDAFPGTPANESLIVYFQRAARARAEFAYAPAPTGFDDRGETYVRFGKPWRIYTEHSGLMGDVGWALYPYEVWFYNPIHPDVYYTFTRKEGQSQFTLVDGPESIYGPFYRGRTTFFNRDVRPAARRGERVPAGRTPATNQSVPSLPLGRNTQLNQANGGETAMKLRDKVYRNLAPSHDNFRRRLYEIANVLTANEGMTQSEAGGYSEAFDYSLLHFTNADRQHAAHVDSVAPAVMFNEDYKAKSLPAVLSFSRFQGPAGKTRTEIYYGGLYRDLKFIKSRQGYQADLRGDIAILNDDYEIVAGDSVWENCMVPGFADADSGHFVGQANFILPPAKYHLLFRLENEAGDQIGNLKYDLEVAAFPENALSLSDLQLSAAIREAAGTSRFVKNGYYVEPLPNLAIPKNKTLFVYFEIYNLKINNASETNYKINYRVFLPRNKGREHSIMLSTSRQGNATKQIEFVELALEKFSRNDTNLELEVVVTDLLAQKEVSGKLPFKIVDAPKKND